MASISASPNPVGVYSATVDARTVINFDVRPEPAPRGRLFVSVDGTEEEILDPALISPSGFVEYKRIKYPKTYTFTLRRQDLSQLASVTVTTFDLRQQLAEGFSYLPQVRPQAIKNLSVRPGVDVVLVTFKTARPTIPLIELRDASGAKIDARFPLFSGLRSEHSAFFGEDRPLALETKHTIHIVASGGAKEVELNAEFISGSRKADIFFDTVNVHDDGDPGIRGEGEFLFSFAAGNADTTESMGEPWPNFGWNSISDDDPPITLNKNITIPQAPRRLWIQTVAVEDDNTALPGEWSFSFREPPHYRTPGSSYHSEDAYQEASATVHLEVEDTPGTPSTTPFELRTGDYDVDFVMSCRLLIDSKFGQFIGPKMYKGRPRPPASAILTSPGDISALSPTLNVADGAIVALGPDNALYHRGIGSLAKRVGVAGWARIELPNPGTPTVVASAADKLDVLLLRDDGAVMHSAKTGKGKAGRWRNLGGDFRQLLAVAEPARSKNAEAAVIVFGVGADGSAHVRDARSDGDWVRLGDQALRAFAAAAVPGVGAVFFATDESRVLRYFLKRNGRWRSEALERPIPGDASPQSLTVVSIEGDQGEAQREIVIGTMSEEQRVQTLHWTGFPSLAPASGWKDAGTVQDLLIVKSNEARGSARTAKKRKSPKRAK